MQLCEQCGKNPANIHLTQISPDGSNVSHLCEECAKSKGISISIEGGRTEGEQSPEPAESEQICCPRCGMSQAHFHQGGRLGCRHCYRTFSDDIDRILVEMHGAGKHRGKRYGQGSEAGETEADIERLRDELVRAIENENFEEAARLRDTISALSTQG